MPRSGRTWTVEWFGTTTFRARRPGLDLFFDGYLDRIPGLDPVGLSVAEVNRADFVFVSHAHFDHLYGVAPIARATGATVVASPESARILRHDGVPEEQLLRVTGGETVRCGPTAFIRVLPALHSGLFAAADSNSAVECVGDLGVSAQDRRQAVQSTLDGFSRAPAPVAEALTTMRDHSSVHDGGQLAFVLRTADGSALFSGSSGYWPGIFASRRVRAQASTARARRMNRAVRALGPICRPGKPSNHVATCGPLPTGRSRPRIWTRSWRRAAGPRPRRTGSHGTSSSSPIASSCARCRRCSWAPVT